MRNQVGMNLLSLPGPGKVVIGPFRMVVVDRFRIWLFFVSVLLAARQADEMNRFATSRV
jgi:hypothetical protein